jgi:type III pantothenate kinase
MCGLITFGVMENVLKLVIDIGNSRTKIALFEGDAIRETHSLKGKFLTTITKLAANHGIPKSCIVSKVQSEEVEILESLKPIEKSRIVFLRSGLLLPLKVLYKTPETLGSDRLANACGAWALNPGCNSLVIDMGTCIKYDFVSDQGNYPGGSISPGLGMRYKALTRFTSQLPYFKPNDEFPSLTGQSTEGSIRSGVENGILEEVNGIINRYKELSDQTHIILTGGDHLKFADKLKSPIFVAPNLTLSGLKVILDHNDQ